MGQHADDEAVIRAKQAAIAALSRATGVAVDLLLRVRIQESQRPDPAGGYWYQAMVDTSPPLLPADLAAMPSVDWDAPAKATLLRIMQEFRGHTEHIYVTPEGEILTFE